MHNYLKNKKPDWYPEKIKNLLGKRGQITAKALKKLCYWELLQIGFNDPAKQKAWMSYYSVELEKHHEFCARTWADSEIDFIDEQIHELEFRKSLIRRY